MPLMDFLSSKEVLRTIKKYGQSGESIAEIIVMGKSLSADGLSREKLKEIDSRIQKENKEQLEKRPTHSGRQLIDFM